MTEKQIAYREKLKNPLWQKKRLFLLARDSWKCQMCGCENEMLSVHHRHYLVGRDPWDYPDELLVTLCDTCHKKEEQAADNAQEMLNTMHHWGVFNTEIIEIFNKVIENKIKEQSTHAEPNTTRLD